MKFINSFKRRSLKMPNEHRSQRGASKSSTMKAFISMLLGLALVTCARGQDKLFIQPLTPIEADSELIVVEEHQIDLQNIGLTKIKLFTVKDWTDPGDVLKIEITNDKGTTAYSNIDGWVKFDHNYPVTRALKELNELKSDKIILVSNDKYALAVLFGWVYASEPGLCTIINLTTGEMVFNDNKELISISADKRNFKFKDKTTTACY